MKTLRELADQTGKTAAHEVLAALLAPSMSTETRTETADKPAGQLAVEQKALAAIQRVIALVNPSATVTQIQAMSIPAIMDAIEAASAGLTAEQRAALTDDKIDLITLYSSLESMGVNWRSAGLGDATTTKTFTTGLVGPSVWETECPGQQAPTLEQIREAMA